MTVYIQLRNIFPGLGATVITDQDFVVAYRIPFGVELEELVRERKEDGIIVAGKVVD